MDAKVEKSGRGNGPSSTTADSSDGEEQDEPSSSNQQQEVEDVLANFREMWQKELRESPKHQYGFMIKTANGKEENEDHENNARNLFLKGIEMEKAGKLYEAIQYYRRAVQIVPDIEFKLDKIPKSKLRERQLTEGNDDENVEEIHCSETEDSDDEEIKDGELLTRIQKKFAKVSPLCIPKFEQKTPHISQVPIEIIFYILRWVVSSDLDLRSLEAFSAVCRGFYLCARDPEIWRLACLR
ncbi:hypothetical protein NQ314_002024 [Rhamnusium bicolor]|uniref:F-box domain-containing protein n=1 Tax=Rhamnusium bicolor TaxID=1586634 RepID=A0AAV8ZTA1_9CUCU|nr:hypothetical protein NQ314_002024 [Rhamnusium bicolor]